MIEIMPLSKSSANRNPPHVKKQFARACFSLHEITRNDKAVKVMSRSNYDETISNLASYRVSLSTYFRSDWVIPVSLSAIIAFGIALRLFRIGDASLWSDELFSVLWIRNSFGFLWGAGLEIETTPPLYYTLLKPWLAVFGSNDISARAMSALLSAATIPMVYLLARQFGGHGASLIASGLFAAMPLQVHYAQEARAYALLPLLYVLATLGVVWFVRCSAGSGGRLTVSRAPPLARQVGPLAVYGLAALMLVYSHATSAFTLAALSLGCVVALWQVRADWKSVLRFAAVNAVVILLSIPEIMAILAQSDRFDMQWVLPPDRISLLNAFAVLLVDPSTPLTLFRLSCILAGAVAVFFAALALRARLNPLVWVLLVGVPVIFLTSTILVSFISPFFIPRIAIWVGVPFCIVAGLVMATPHSPQWVRIGFAGALLVAWGVGLNGVYARSILAKEDWRGLAAEVEPLFQDHCLVAIGPGTNLRGIAYYVSPAVQQYRWRPAFVPNHPLLFLPEGVPLPETMTTNTLSEHVRSGRCVSLLLKQRDWENYGNDAVNAAPDMPPVINQRYAMLTLLRWPGAGQP